LERAVDGATVAQRALGIPTLERNAELPQIVANVGEHDLERMIEHAAKSVSTDQNTRPLDDGVDVLVLVSRRRIFRQAGEYLPRRSMRLGVCLCGQLFCDRTYVIAPIAVGRKHERLAAGLQVAQPGADC